MLKRRQRHFMWWDALQKNAVGECEQHERLIQLSLKFEFIVTYTHVTFLTEDEGTDKQVLL